MSDEPDQPEAIADPVERALAFAFRYSQIDGEHHKAWVIDQMVRALTGCQASEVHATDVNDKPYTYLRQGANATYTAFVAEHNDGEDGPDTYTWDEGTAP
jgi:hypothetical protein